MLCGIFDHVDAGGRAQADHYEMRLRLIEAIDALGFHAYFIAEHHGTPLGLAPSPNLLLSAVAQRTRRLRFGALIYIAAMYHPMRLAEEICMLDQLSRGRLQVGLGRGAVFIEQRLYDIDPDEVPQRYAEARDIILRALDGGTVDFEGQYLRVRDFPMVLEPYQRPRPPLWYGVGSVDSARWAAENGVNCVSLMPVERVAPLFDAFRARWAECGGDAPMPLLGLNRHIVVAESAEAARAIARPAFLAWRASFSALWDRAGAALPTRFPESWDALEQAGLGIAGPPETVTAYLSGQAAAVGASYIGCQMIFGTMAEADARRSIELFAQGVMPRLG